MKSHRYPRNLLAGSSGVIWLGAIASTLLSVAIGAETSLAIGAMSGVLGVILSAAALAVVQMARALLEIAAHTAVLAGRADPVMEAEDVEGTEEVEEAAELDQPEILPKVVGRIEPRLQPRARVEPPLFRPGSEAGGLRAVRS